MLASRKELIALLREHSVKWGDFTLASGKKSDLYVDVRQTALRARGARLISMAVLRSLDPQVQAIGGVELGAVPIIGSVLATQDESTTAYQGLPGFIVRKTAKGHGTKSPVENCPPPGTKVAIIEDVTTTGGSLVAAMEQARLAGLVVVQAITVVDREEGAAEFLVASGYVEPAFQFTPLVMRTDLLVLQRILELDP